MFDGCVIVSSPPNCSGITKWFYSSLKSIRLQTSACVGNKIFSTARCLDSLTSVCFHKFTSGNHLILLRSNKTASGAIIAGKNCNKVYMLTGLVPALLKRVDSSTNSLNVSRAAFEISSYSFWEGYRLTGLIICDKTLLYSPLQKKKGKRKTWRWGCHLWNCKSGKSLLANAAPVHEAWVSPLAWLLFYSEESKRQKCLFSSNPFS